MVQALDEAQNQSMDLPAIPIPPPSHPHHTGAPGRPRLEIDPGILESTLAVETKTKVADMLGCSARTIRRRELDFKRQTGIALTPQRSSLSDERLDEVVAALLQEFPHYGRSMLMGAITANGHNVPERRIRESYTRVCGAPGQFFGSRRIHRRKYYVPAANSLWHHDGQHGGLFPVSWTTLHLIASQV